MQSIPDAPLLTTNIARAAQELETLKFFQLESLGYAKISKSIHQVQIVTPQKKTSLIACWTNVFNYLLTVAFIIPPPP